MRLTYEARSKCEYDSSRSMSILAGAKPRGRLAYSGNQYTAFPCDRARQIKLKTITTNFSDQSAVKYNMNMTQGYWQGKGKHMPIRRTTGSTA
eukprot:scaffold26318_cov52-Cyclotella_meneghiniana.AAC.5